MLEPTAVGRSNGLTRVGSMGLATSGAALLLCAWDGGQGNKRMHQVCRAAAPLASSTVRPAARCTTLDLPGDVGPRAQGGRGTGAGDVGAELTNAPLAVLSAMPLGCGRCTLPSSEAAHT